MKTHSIEEGRIFSFTYEEGNDYVCVMEECDQYFTTKYKRDEMLELSRMIYDMAQLMPKDSIFKRLKNAVMRWIPYGKTKTFRR